MLKLDGCDVHRLVLIIYEEPKKKVQQALPCILPLDILLRNAKKQIQKMRHYQFSIQYSSRHVFVIWSTILCEQLYVDKIRIFRKREACQKYIGWN